MNTLLKHKINWMIEGECYFMQHESIQPQLLKVGGWIYREWCVQ